MKRFRTIIEIATEAEDKNEAMEIVGEYLSGNLVSGIDMKCTTRPIINYKKRALAITLTVFFLGALMISKPYLDHSKNLLASATGVNAVQPPLKTSDISKKDSRFKEEWETRHTRQALDIITK